MNEKLSKKEEDVSDTFEIIPTDCSASEVESNGFESSGGTSRKKVRHSNAVKQRNDNHSGFSLGLGCTINSLFSGLSESPYQTVKKGSSVWFLGIPYFREEVGIPVWKKKKLHKKSSKIAADPFRYDFYSRLWFTYRRNFPKLGSRFTSDCGWGCMLRTGQMMLAQALVIFHFGRDWRWNPEESDLDKLHRSVIALFGDTEDCPFSVHNLVKFGKKVGKRPGDWFGPSSVAYVLRDCLNAASNAADIIRNVRIYVASDTTVIPSEVEKLFGTGEGSTNCVVVMVPVRLGMEKLNQLYVPAIKQLLAMKCAIGIIGGRPKHSLYFTGWQDEYLIYFDPHFCQPAVDVRSEDFPLESFHCNIPRRMSFQRLDPSMCFGFCFQNIAEFHAFKEAVDMILTSSTKCNLHMFTISEKTVCPPATLEDSITSVMSDLSVFSYEFV